jgi:hypothetical protein
MAHGDNEPLPARDIIPAHFDDFRAVAAASEHRRRQPRIDVGREVTNDIAAARVNPHS